MKKRWNKIFALLLAVCSLFFVVSCDSSQNDAATSDGTEMAEDGRIHQFDVQETSTKFVSNGRCLYTIVYPEDIDAMERLAVDELISFTNEATGITLKSISDNAVSNYDSSVRYISLGDTELLEESGLQLDKSELNGDGYYIKSKGNSIFIVGGNGTGTLNGVYTFLKYQFGFEYYADNAYVLDKNVKNNILRSYDVMDVPDIKYRTAGFGEINYNELNTRRLGFIPGDEVFIPLCGQTIHNVFFVVPKDGEDKNYENHPDWYATTGNQLCYMRDIEGLSNYVVEKMKLDLIKYPDMDTLSFTQNDVANWCACEKCTETIKHYGGANSATQIIFINEVAKKLNAWLAVEYPGREVTICIFAYFVTMDAPVKLDEATGEYVPIDEKIICEPNVAVYFAPYQMKNYYALDQAPNVNTYTALKKWMTICDKSYIWLYGCHFSNYLIPFDNISSLQRTLQVMVENNAEYFYIQAQWNSVASDWSRLKMYLQAKLMWDCKQDVNELIEKFIKCYFGEASDAMLEYFYDYKAYSAYLATEHGFENTANLTNVYTSAEAWKLPVLLKWKSYMEKAYEKIELLQYSDPERYQLYYDRIRLEEIATDSLLISYHASYFSVSEYNALSQQLESDCTRLRIAKGE